MQWHRYRSLINRIQSMLSSQAQTEALPLTHLIQKGKSMSLLHAEEQNELPDQKLFCMYIACMLTLHEFVYCA